MAKTFGELKAGDTIYWMSVHTINTGTKNPNPNINEIIATIEKNAKGL